MGVLRQLSRAARDVLGEGEIVSANVTAISSLESATDEVINDAKVYGVAIEPVDATPGTEFWRVVRVHHLTPEENKGNHHIYLDVLDEAGARIQGAQLRVTWDGGEQVVTIDKPANEPGANFPMWKYQICSVEAIGLPSDRVTNLHTGHPDEAPGNTLFHHSFAVTFQRAREEEGVEKPLVHYVLFGPAKAVGTKTNLFLAMDYLLTFGLTFGYDPTEAASARRVTIIGDETAVSAEAEAALVAAGCQVERLAGNASDIAQALAEKVASG